MSEEKKRLEEDRKKERHWRRFGPYLSERQWGTVREDYSQDGEAWTYFPQPQAHKRAYRWGEDGLAGISDNHQRICFAFAFWNEEDPILKERLFGLSGKEANHGEDVKEYYYYLDNTPTHSYMKYLYKYPQRAFPYAQLVEENKRRGQKDPEFELIDTGIFSESKYFDIFIEYAKADAEDLVAKATIFNRGPETKKLHVLPTLWFRNRWSWGKNDPKPHLKLEKGGIEASKFDDEKMYFYYPEPNEVLFTENETNFESLFGTKNASPYVKDAFHEYIIKKKKEAVNPAQVGTKAAVHYVLEIPPNQSKTLAFRLSTKEVSKPLDNIDQIIAKRQQEADNFYQEIGGFAKDEGLRSVQRQAYSGMLWNKQFYHYVVESWLKGDAQHPVHRQHSRNADWIHLYNDDVLSLPDKWEYPFFCAWDMGFHCLPLAILDPEFAKRQLLLLTREWYMNPSGQIPAYEWSFSDSNPPVHAWAAWRIYKIEKKRYGNIDRLFLERIFQKLLLNFTWWVNRKDTDGKNVFQGGFLGLDNISLFNRSDQLPKGAKLYQSDATSWMGMYCLNMLTIAFELSEKEESYEDMASKFFEHFLYISDAINGTTEKGLSLWNEEDGFYYDVLSTANGESFPLKIRSMVGIIPLFAVATITPETLDRFKGFAKRFEWFLRNRGDLCGKMACMETEGKMRRRIFAIVNQERLKRVLEKVLDEEEFLSPYGIRSLSKYHHKHPYSLKLDGHSYTIDYEPAEATTLLFGGNSNWRGPVWFPLNMLIIESLQKFHYYYGDDFKVECPKGSGKWMNLWEVSLEISRRLVSLFDRDKNGKRPIYGENKTFQEDPHFKDYTLFYEYFHGENGKGLGASHQTGWTGLVGKLITQLSEYQGM